MKPHISHYSEFLQQNMVWIEKVSRGLMLGATILLSLFLVYCVINAPISIRVRVRGQTVELAGFAKLIVCTIIMVIGAVHGYVFYWLHPLLIPAKLFLIEFLAVCILICWFGILNARSWHAQLVQVERECELARTLTYMQGEMARHQLEILNERIRNSIEPAEVEIRETLFKSLSPVLMLFLKKEKSIMKWSLAAVNIGKNLSKYFWSPKRQGSE